MTSRDLYVKIERYLANEKSMIFLAGSRQSDKTTLAQIIFRFFANNLYLPSKVGRPISFPLLARALRVCYNSVRTFDNLTYSVGSETT